MNILITGMAGFIGSNLASRLISEGNNVVGIVRSRKPLCSLNLLGLEGKVNIVFGDVTDRRLIERTIADYQVDAIFHLAAEAIVAHAQRAPLQAIETNIIGPATVFEAARVCGGVKSIVHQSSDHVYGDNKLPFTEDLAFLANTPYDASKAAGDIIARMYAHTYNLPIIVARPANNYGCGDTHRRIIPNIIRDCIAGKPPVIFSKDDKREYIFVEDTVEALLLLAKNAENYKGYAFNVGTGDTKNNGEVVTEILKLFPGLEPVYVEPTDLKEIAKQYIDSSKIMCLGWKPKISFEEGIKRTVKWWKTI